MTRPESQIASLLLVLMLTLLVFPNQSEAYISSYGNSIECDVENADCVVRGVVLDVRKEHLAAEPHDWRINTVRVIEVLKGPPVSKLIFAEPWYETFPWNKLFLDDEQLFCLVKGT